MSAPSLDISQGIATITFNRPQTYNAITAEDYDTFATMLRKVDKRDDVLVTVWQATGKWFCAGTDVKSRSEPAKESDTIDIRQAFLTSVARANTDCSHALYSHSKILVAAMNGPVLGIAAAFLGHFDFIYCMPDAWLAVPFTFIGLVAEGGSSVSFVNRMGLAKANEVLLWGKKKDARELLACGFVNEIFPSQSDGEFRAAVRTRLLDELAGLDPTALLAIKKLIKAGLTDKNDPDAVNLRESYRQAEAFSTGVPQKQFRRLATREIKHKL